MTVKFWCEDGSEVVVELDDATWDEGVNLFTVGEWTRDHSRAEVEAYLLRCQRPDGRTHLHKPEVALA